MHFLGGPQPFILQHQPTHVPALGCGDCTRQVAGLRDASQDGLPTAAKILIGLTAIGVVLGIASVVMKRPHNA